MAKDNLTIFTQSLCRIIRDENLTQDSFSFHRGALGRLKRGQGLLKTGLEVLDEMDYEIIIKKRPTN